MDDQIKNKEQITAIKERLNRYREEAGLTLGALTEKINQETDIEVNYNTLRSTLDYSKDVINTFVVIGICRCLGKDIAMTLSPPGTKDNTLQNTSMDFLNSGKFIILNDPKCFGKFYGYFPNDASGTPKLQHFELEIRKTDNSVRAIMRNFKEGKYCVTESDADPDFLIGTPYYDTVHSEIFMTLTNDIGKFYFLYMKDPDIHSDAMYFARGIALRPATHNGNPILSMNFVLLRNPINNSDASCIAGMLASPAPSFQIAEEDIEFLKEEDPLIAKFFKEFEYLLEHEKHSVYTINESMILASSCRTLTKYQVVEALMIIKDYSYAPKRVRYDEPRRYYEFARDYLQKQ